MMGKLKKLHTGMSRGKMPVAMGMRKISLPKSFRSKGINSWHQGHRDREFMEEEDD